MQKTTATFTIITVMLGIASVFLYQGNSALSSEISATMEQCALRIGALQKQYQGEIDDLRNYVQEQYNHNPESIIQKPEKTGFNQLVSRGHQMQAIGNKYESVLFSAPLDENGKNRLRQLLFQREQQADSVKSAADPAAARKLQNELNDTEAKIRALLPHPMDYDHYKIQRQRDL
jgi:hypothetical protein